MKQLRICALAVVAVLGLSTWTMAQNNGRAQDAYQAGMQQGREDAHHNVSPMPHPEHWTEDREQKAFDAGYDRGYDETMGQQGNWTDRAAYKEGMRQGKMDSRHNVAYAPHPGRRTNEQDRRAFIAGYNRGFHETAAVHIPGLNINIR